VIDPLVVGAIAVYQGAAITCAFLAGLAYEISARRRREESDLEQVFVIGLSAAAIVLGVRILILLATSDDLGPFHGDDVIYIGMGAIALIWVSGTQVWRLLRPKDE
jgi:peptidoglycan/LPS O-acetylase OafA/YrhL